MNLQLMSCSPDTDEAWRHASCDTLQQQLTAHLQGRLCPSMADLEADDGTTAADERLMGDFLIEERRHILKRAASAPQDPDGFMAWFEDLAVRGPGQGDELFPWLAGEATLDDLKWFLHQELAGEAGFDDLVALTMIRMPARPKMEMARNLWDEFGRGSTLAVHGALLQRLSRDLDLSAIGDGIVWESLALGNLMAAMALDRRYAYHSVGALGVIEMTAPGRVSDVNAGLRRLGVGAATRRYHEVHASLDIEHSRRWNLEVIRPLVASDPRLATHLAEGALMRLEAGRRCFVRYRDHFGIGVASSARDN